MNSSILFSNKKVTAGLTTLPQTRTNMNILSIHKGEKLSTAKVIGRWWNSKNSFFSTFAGEDFTNKEVILAHLILMLLLACAAFIEICPIVAILAMGIGGVCVRLLNKISKKS